MTADVTNIVRGQVTEGVNPNGVGGDNGQITLIANTPTAMNGGVTPLDSNGKKLPAMQGVTVQADSANTGSVRVGWSNCTGTTFGLELVKGGSVTMPTDDPSKVYCFAAVSGLKVNCIWI